MAKEFNGVSVHAGFPNPATDSLIKSPDFNRLLVKHPASTFCFRIEGRDWEGEGIYSGDIAVVDRAQDPIKTDAVIWTHEGSFAISKFTKVPAEAEVWGVVTATIHSLRAVSEEP